MSAPRQPTAAGEEGRGNRWPWGLVALGLVLAALYAGVTRLSLQFIHGERFAERPIVEVLLLLTAALGVYLAALCVALRGADTRRLVWTIVAGAVLFRLLLLPSRPIQEVDIYRYLWDGAAVCHGVSPFRYSPQQVLVADDHADQPADLRRLLALRDDSPTDRKILERVDHGYLPTIYPPVSQAVFAAATLVTPSAASVATRLLVCKGAMAVFDLATLLLMVRLLRIAGRHAGWSLAYGWCPLVLKEVANSGHLDAVAVFFTTAAVTVAATGVFRARRRADARRGNRAAATAALLLALAVGAKLYAVVLVPLLFFTAVRRVGWRAALVAAGLFVLLAGLLLLPMRPRAASQPRVAAVAADVPPLPEPLEEPRDGPLAGPLPAGGVAPAPAAPAMQPQDPSRGLATFLGRWEMNDFLFLIVVENLRPLGEVPATERPWFALVPESWRVALTRPIATRWGIDAASAAFRLTRLLTGATFLGIALVLAWRGSRAESADAWLRAAFLTLAWFWLLLPTQNPWYWMWALPLIPFARSRAWLAMAGLVLLYYLRFWLIYHWGQQPLPPWPAAPLPHPGYRGALYFDFVVTWIEFAPWLLWLAADYFLWRRRGGAKDESGKKEPPRTPR